MAETLTLDNLDTLAIGYTAMYGLPISTVNGLVRSDGLEEDEVKDYGSDAIKYYFRGGDPRFEVKFFVTCRKTIPKSGPFAGTPVTKSAIRTVITVKHVETDTTPDTLLGRYPMTAVIAWDIPQAVDFDVETTRRLLDLAYFFTHGSPLIDTPGDAAVVVEGPLYDLQHGSAKLQVYD